MNKINGFRKTLALLLAVLIAVPALGLSAFALEPVYTQVLTSSEYAESGDYWYDGYALADATGTEVYRYDAQYYLSDDADVLKITYTLNDEPVTELRTRADDADYFAYLYVLPAFNLLPTSPDGLEDGVYWYDQDGMVNYATKHYQESSLPRYTTADYYLSVDGTMLRRTYVHSSYGYSYTYHVDEFLDRPGTMCRFLRQAGVDPNAGFTKIPKSDEGLQTGDYWFDAAGLAERFGTYGQDYLDAEYYLSDDAGTLRVIQTDGIPSDYELSQGGLMGTYLHQVGVDPNAGFSLLPKSADGLADGSYWFDAAALAEIAGEYGSVYLNADYYLSDDGETIRMILFASPSEYKKSEGGFLFTYLRQVGVDPNAGFSLLPKSAEGLSDGDYWYDAAGLAALAGEYADMYQSADYYLSDDGNTLRIMANGQKLDFATEDDGASTFFSYLHQVGGTPIEHFNLLPTSPDGLADGAYWYDAAALSVTLEEPDLINSEYYLSDDAQTLRIYMSGYPTEISADSDEGSIFFGFLYQVGVDPDAGFEPVYLSEAEAHCRGYVLDIDAYIDYYIEDSNADRVKNGKEPFTPEEEAKERANLRAEIALYEIAINTQQKKLRLSAEGQQMLFGENSQMYKELSQFISLFTSDNHEWGAWVADGAEETRTCVRCGETESRAAAGDKVLWAGYEEYNGVKTDNTVYVIAKKGAAKVQLRYAMGTVSYTRKNANAAISDVIFDGYDCELWTISRELTDGNYVAVAKYGSTLLADIPDADGASFTVTTPAAQEPEVSSNVAGAEIAGIENGVITFDGKTAQTITIRTGTDVQKVQLQSNIDGKSFTYNTVNAVVTEGTSGDGSPCLVWTITRIFTAGDYDFSINVRTQQNGLTDSGMDLVFTVV
ncbi:MAG: hypothetical protein IJT41_05730 [Clostridia bacterium]|nr:hypothetical protein [Clostridia bacterium]